MTDEALLLPAHWQLIALFITSARDYVREDKKIMAGLVLAKLRLIHEALGSKLFPAGERTWQGFVEEHFAEIGYERVQALIGQVVHRGGILKCTKCEAEAVCRCGCGVAYLPQNQWAAASCNENMMNIVAPPPKSRGRPRIGDNPMTSTERSRRRRAKGSTNPLTGSSVGSI